MNTLIDQWRRAQFVWGETDCIMATCNYVRDMTGIDPAAPWRGTYIDEAGAQAIWQAHGGVLAMADRIMGQAGFNRAEPHPGFPVVCDFGGHEVAGVHIGPMTAFMGLHGCVETRAKILGCWAL
jgi:hypothetical protein